MIGTAAAHMIELVKRFKIQTIHQGIQKSYQVVLLNVLIDSFRKKKSSCCDYDCENTSSDLHNYLYTIKIAVVHNIEKTCVKKVEAFKKTGGLRKMEF